MDTLKKLQDVSDTLDSIHQDLNEEERYRYSASDKLFFTSDTHFCHSKIIEFANRPFTSVQEMNEVLVWNWNEVVPKDGIVFHLGDLCFGTSEQWLQILSRLNGNIHLILGNHDIPDSI